MQRIASVLAHVLASAATASTAFVACGGSVAEIPDNESTLPSGPGRTTATSPSNPAPPNTSTPRPPIVDSGVRDATVDATPPDAGCSLVAVSAEPNSCMDIWMPTCGVPDGVDSSDGMTQEECDLVCGKRSGSFSYWGCGPYKGSDLQSPAFACYTCGEGRRPSGYEEPVVDDTVGGWLAHAADLERVSIDAFQILARELAHHGAPAALIAHAQRAEQDEVRHTKMLTALARKEGASVSDVKVSHGPVRSLLDIAIENAVEGCVRETYGAVVAGWQAEHASRIDVRRAMKAIYRDETSHSELAWRVHAWIMNHLDGAERARVEGAMKKAMTELFEAAARPVSRAHVEALGLPPAAEARRLVTGLHAHLWTTCSLASAA